MSIIARAWNTYQQLLVTNPWKTQIIGTGKNINKDSSFVRDILENNVGSFMHGIFSVSVSVSDVRSSAGRMEYVPVLFWRRIGTKFKSFNHTIPHHVTPLIDGLIYIITDIRTSPIKSGSVTSCMMMSLQVIRCMLSETEIFSLPKQNFSNSPPTQ